MSMTGPCAGQRALLLLAALWGCNSAPAWPVLQVGKSQVQLAVEGESAFRISISYAGTPAQTPSRMIASKTDTAHFQDLSSGGVAALNTSFGQVRIDSSGSFSLLDSNKKVLIASSALSSYKDGKNDELSVFLGIPASSKGSARKYYAAGYKPGSALTATQSTPSVGNDYGRGAWSWAPQYFSPSDAYAALAVGKHDLPRTDSGAGICVGDTTGRQDCGFYGITESVCEAKNCCWGPTNESLPWCYSKTSASLADYPASWKSQDDGVAWTILGSAVDIYLMPASDAKNFRRSHSQLTGAPGMIPRYAFGFMAGRWGWENKADIESKLDRFRNENYPIDAFISDFEWFTTSNDYGLPPHGSASYTDFGYNSGTFPNPKEQLAKYHSMGFKFGGIRKPRLGNTELLNEVRSKGWLVPGGVNGKNRNMNFSTPAARDWYAQQNQHYLDDGVDFWWNDEGEVTYFMFDEWNDALASGVKKKDPTRRYFSLNRAFTPGMQRYGLAIWTGDISVSWESMANQPEAMLNAELMGIPYVGCDTGGFKGGNDAPEMLTRWYQLAAFMSIMRVHSNNQQIPHFPFLYGAEAGDAMRKVLELRYHLIPTIYSLGHLAFTDGTPINRPLFMEFGSDEKAWTITSQWLVGSGLMAAPVMAPGGSREVYFPAGTTWYEFNTTTTHVGGTSKTISVPLDVVPVYCRAGTVLTLAPKIQHTGQLPGGALEVQIYSGADAHFTLVEDDGETTAYATDAKIHTRRTTISWTEATKTLSLEVEGSFEKDIFRQFVFKKFSANGGVQTKHSQKVLASGQQLSIKFEGATQIMI